LARAAGFAAAAFFTAGLAILACFLATLGRLPKVAVVAGFFEADFGAFLVAIAE
jgi:hypothetical protein